MGEDPRAGGAPVTEEGAAREPHEIREDIESTRREMGDTVEALAKKADVKAQTQRKVAEVKQSVDAKRQEVLGKAHSASPDSAGSAASVVAQKARENPVPLGIAGAFFAGLIVGRALKR
jgi:hypothetical protein